MKKEPLMDRRAADVGDRERAPGTQAGTLIRRPGMAAAVPAARGSA